uniref:Polyketide_cyc domain-containing protein n=1 Tax=Heterorhabditis bacteriophora TaxID=37862 RepID=A0A1I7XAI7_HETBA
MGLSHRSVRLYNNKEMAYSEKRLIGFSRDQMFDVVLNVADYHLFVPWCRRSIVSHEHMNSQIAELEIGFPPLLESYTSRVIHVRPSVVHSVCLDESLFRTLDTTFRFGKGLPDNPLSCILHYDLTFEFKSSLHSRIAHLFFDNVVKTMVNAFLQRAEHTHGKPSIPHSPPEIIQYKS